MSSTPKYAGYSIVPWYNSAEWKNVYKLIFKKNSKNEDLKTALDIITLWQMRTPLLPSGVEGTLCILEAMLIENDELSERRYQILCASSIMRFLNICVASRAQVNNFTRTAKDNCIPDWIISIRHDFAHSQRLPSVSLLKLALKESFKWLENTYWKPELNIITDNIISGAQSAHHRLSTLEMHELVGLYCNLFVYDAKNLCYDEFIQDKLEMVDATSKIDEFPKVILTLLEQGVKNVSAMEWKKCLDEMTYSHWYIIGPNSLVDKRGNCNKNYINLSNLMNLLAKQNMITDLITELLYVISDDWELDENKIGVAQWINEIFKGMLKCGKKQLPPGVMPGFGINFKQLHVDCLIGIKQLKFRITTAIPDNYRKYFINSYLFLLNENADDITRIVKTLGKKTSVYETFSECDSDDLLKMQTEDVAYHKQVLNRHLNDEEADMDVQENQELTIELDTNCNNNKGWSLITDTSIFESYPLGVIPPQWT